MELFAGLRTTHLAAKALDGACIVMSHAAEECEFANSLSVKNRVEETLHTDVRDMGEGWAKQFVEAASKRECQVILVVAGFPFPEQNRQLAEQGLQAQGIYTVLRDSSDPLNTPQAC